MTDPEIVERVRANVDASVRVRCARRGHAWAQSPEGRLVRERMERAWVEVMWPAMEAELLGRPFSARRGLDDLGSGSRGDFEGWG